MTTEEIYEMRRTLRGNKAKTTYMVAEVVNLFDRIGVKNYTLTGSAALILQGFITYRTPDDIDMTIPIPEDAKEREILLKVVDTLTALCPNESLKAAEYSQDSQKGILKVFRTACGVKVNAFLMKREEYMMIPCNNVNGMRTEMVASVLATKMGLKRPKDYKDLNKVFSEFSGYGL